MGQSAATTDATPDPDRDLATLRDTDHAHQACRELIEAYAKNPEQVDWSDVQTALAHALRAFKLPDDYPDRLFQRAMDAEIA